MREFTEQALAHTTWSFAKVDQSDEKLFVSLASSSEWPMREFTAQELANTAWALTDSAALHARELVKRSSRGGSWGGWVIVLFYTQG